MSLFESGVRAGHDAGAARYSAGIADFGSRPARRSAELVGRAAISRPSVDVAGPIARAFNAILRLVVPTLLLVAVGAAAFLFGNEPINWFGNIDVGGKPLGLGLLIVPATFFVVHLTNRRFGAGYGLAQIFAAWIITFGTLPYTQTIVPFFHDATTPSTWLAASFGGGLLIGQIVSVFVFDRMRGPQWWQAPLFASAVGGVVTCLVAYPLAYAASGHAWTSAMFDYMGVLLAASVVMVVPYWLLRSIVPPMSGFGGY